MRHPPRRARLNKFPWGLLLTALLCVSLLSCAHAPPPVVEQRGGAVAVWDLDDLSPDPAENLGELFSAQVMALLGAKGTYSVVERTRILRILEELRLGSSSLADEQTRLKLGKVVGAHLMVFGGYMVIGGQMRVDLRLVEVETGKVVKAVRKIATTPDLTARIVAVRQAAEEL